MTAAKNWDRADAISDKIVDMLKEEVTRADFSPTQTLAGLMLGMCAYATSCPRSLAPQPFVDVMNSIQLCLTSMIAERAEEK
jgi:hypothetical protein